MTPDLNSRAQMTHTPIDIEALEALEKAATPGEWSRRTENLRGGRFYVVSRHHAYETIDLHADEHGEEDSAFIASLRNAAPELIKAAKERSDIETENTRLRAALSVSKDPCIYCQLPADKLAECKSGFPGCGRADDMMGCPEFGASMMLNDAQSHLASLRALLAEAGERMIDVQSHAAVWASLLKQARDASPPPTEDMDDRSYYQHELDVLARIGRDFVAIQSALRDASPTMEPK